MSEVAFEALLGRRVFDEAGRRVGRLEEALAEERGGEWVVVEFHTGAAGFFERLAARLGTGDARGLRIPWDRLDLTNPERPVVTGDVADLRALARPRR